RASDSQPERSLRNVTLEPEREQDMRRLGVARGARGAARRRESREVERDDEGLALCAREAERGVVRQPLRPMSGEDRIGHASQDAVDDPVAQSRLPRRLRRASLRSDAKRDAEADDTGNVLGPGATALLLPAT